MKQQQSDKRDDVRRDLEELYESWFPPVDSNLRRLLDLHQERRARGNRVIDTVVTYGAYEEPI